MVLQHYDWENPPKLDDHSKCKHNIIRDYFSDYLKTRCQSFQQRKFKLAVVDGFSGGGIYYGGEQGSPIIFLDTINKTILEINKTREEGKKPPITIECHFVFNDSDRSAINLLEKTLTPFKEKIDNQKYLKCSIEIINKDFKISYYEIKNSLKLKKIKNVLFLIDQYGYKDAPVFLIEDIITSFQKAEVFYNLSIQSFFTFLNKDAIAAKEKIDRLFPNYDNNIFKELKGKDFLSKREHAYIMERLVFSGLSGYAAYVSPFAIENPDGWKYWFLHFSNNLRARHVYTSTLYKNSNNQLHLGQKGLYMLRYNPEDDLNPFLFRDDQRDQCLNALLHDIPEFLSKIPKQSLTLEEFYTLISNKTPAHNDDIEKAILISNDISITTKKGGERRSINNFKPSDKIYLKPQMKFYF